MSIPFYKLSDAELGDIAFDYFKSKDDGYRCEALVPYAEYLRDKIDHNEPLCYFLDSAAQDFFRVLSDRFRDKINDNTDSFMKMSMKHLSSDTQALLFRVAHTGEQNSLIPLWQAERTASWSS